MTNASYKRLWPGRLEMASESVFYCTSTAGTMVPLLAWELDRPFHSNQVLTELDAGALPRDVGPLVSKRHLSGELKRGWRWRWARVAYFSITPRTFALPSWTDAGRTSKRVVGAIPRRMWGQKAG